MQSDKRSKYAERKGAYEYGFFSCTVLIISKTVTSDKSYKNSNYSEPCAQTAISVPAIAQWHIHVPIREHSTILGPVLREQKQPSSPVLSSY